MSNFDTLFPIHEKPDRIEIKKMALGYRAETSVFVAPGSPYRTMFMSGMRIVRGRGRTAESAALRCKAEAEKIRRLDQEWQEKEAARTQYVNL